VWVNLVHPQRERLRPHCLPLHEAHTRRMGWDAREDDWCVWRVNRGSPHTSRTALRPAAH
jgi:hypothetical protein